jgi:hypothetical protein
MNIDIMLYTLSQNRKKRLLASSCLFVRPSARPEKRGSHWTDFHQIWYLTIFLNLSRKFKFHQNITKTINTLHEDQYTVSSYLSLLFLEWKTFQVNWKLKITISYSHSCAVHSDVVQRFISPTNVHQYRNFSEAQTASSLMMVWLNRNM